MELPDWITLGGFVAVLAFLWTLHRDMANLRERMARLEGRFDEMSRYIATITGNRNTPSTGDTT